MRCPSCGSENPDGLSVCGACAAPLVLVCPRCATENPARFRFCGQCATPLPRAAAGVPPLPTEQSARDAERRQLTVMFCDLVGATALSAQLDPEDLREVLREYQAVCAAAVGRYDGHIVQYLGDGILVYFGHPRAHEDDAQRAVRTGLAILADMAPLGARLEQARGVRLAVRVGIHTGLVVAGEMGGGGWRETLAVGETPNIAARLQALAEPNTLVISPATYRLVRGYFTCQSRGPQPLKGVPQPMEVHQVLQETGARSRLDVALATGLTAPVGRHEELGRLRGHWAAVQTGAGTVVLLSGEAGIGKSRLVQMLRAEVAPLTWLECRCSPYYQNSAWYPLIEFFQDWLELRREATADDKLRKVERGLARYGLSLPDVVPLFAALLSVPLGAPYAPLGLPPLRQRQKTLEAMVALLRAMAAAQPVLLVVEDLHWADPSTLELLGLLIDQTPPGLLLVLTFRPDFSPPWSPRPQLVPLALARFTRAEVEAIVDRVAGGKRLPAELLHQIVTKTDGNPLFVEELTKMLLESGALRPQNGHYELVGAFDPRAIPATLQDSLMARLDRLPEAKAVAQLGATVGREFSFELLQAVSQVDAASLERALRQLVAAELLHQQGPASHVTTYAFKHALVQDIAYQSVLKSTRQQYHPRIARVLEERFPETAETRPELLAHHYTAAGLTERAIPYWERGGRRAMERSANLEAIAHLRKGLELLETLPATPDHAQQELALQVTLSMPLMATQGWAAPAVEQASARARALCQHVGQSSQLLPALWGLWNFSIIRTRLQTARELAEQFMRLAEGAEDPVLLLHARYVSGDTCFWLGELTSARAHLEQDVALDDPIRRRPHAVLFGLDPGVACLSHAAWTLWLLGYPVQASKRASQALTVARELSHPLSTAWALYSTARRWYTRTAVKRATSRSGPRRCSPSRPSKAFRTGRCWDGCSAAGP